MAPGPEREWEPNMLQPMSRRKALSLSGKSCDFNNKSTYDTSMESVEEQQLGSPEIRSKYHTPDSSLHSSPPTLPKIMSEVPQKQKKTADKGPPSLESVGGIQNEKRPTCTQKPVLRDADYHQAIELEKQCKEENRAEKQIKTTQGTGKIQAEETYCTLLDIQAQADDSELSDLTELTELEDDEEVYFAGIAKNGLSEHSLPKNANEAFKGPDGEHWRPALQEELQNLIDNDVFEVVPMPKGVRPITSKLVFCIKYDANGNVEYYKVRIVAWGFTQVKGVDYKEVWALVANLESYK